MTNLHGKVVVVTGAAQGQGAAQAAACATAGATVIGLDLREAPTASALTTSPREGLGGTARRPRQRARHGRTAW